MCLLLDVWRNESCSPANSPTAQRCATCACQNQFHNYFEVKVFANHLRSHHHQQCTIKLSLPMKSLCTCGLGLQVQNSCVHGSPTVLGFYVQNSQPLNTFQELNQVELWPNLDFRFGSDEWMASLLFNNEKLDPGKWVKNWNLPVTGFKVGHEWVSKSADKMLGPGTRLPVPNIAKAQIRASCH